MNKIILIMIFILAVFPSFGQENTLHNEIQQAKNSNVHFENTVLTLTDANNKEILQRFTNANEVFFFENILFDVNNAKAINLVLPTLNKNIVLELVEAPESFYDYDVITSDGNKFPASRDIKHYRGIVQNESNSIAAITLYKDEIIGLICTDEGNLNIAKDKQSGKYIFYNDKNLKEQNKFDCGTVDNFSFEYDTEVLLKERNNLTKQKHHATFQAAIDKEVKFYVETEYDIYQNKGSVTSVEAFISSLFNQVAILYQNEDILTRVSQIYVWTSNDPYTETSTAALLTKFQNTRTSIAGDLGILLTTRSIGGGQAAGFNGLCNNANSAKLSVAMIYSSNIVSVPTYSWSVQVVTHELGHLFGSRHTHACVWNGNNTAIDGCAGFVEGNCQLPGNPSAGGTIMSYCHLAPQGINFNLGFGLQPGNVIRNSVINANCLQDICTSTTLTGQQPTKLVKCKEIIMQNATVPAGVTLELKATERIVINSGVTVKTGGTLILNGAVVVNPDFPGYIVEEGAAFVIK